MIKIFIITLLLLGTLNRAKAFEAPDVNTKTPLRIKSKKVDIHRDSGEMIFIDNVKARQGELEILSDVMIIDYTEEKNTQIEIKKITANENVKLFTDRISASGNSSIYDFKNSLVTLMGNVTANEMGAIAYGDEFIYHIDTQKTEIFGDKKEDDRAIIILEDIEDFQKRMKQRKENNEKSEAE